MYWSTTRVGTVPSTFWDVNDGTLDAMLELNLRSVFVAAQAAAARMVDSGGGSIINMSSQMGHVGGPLRSVYCMTKWGVEGMTRAMAVDLAPRNVRLNTVVSYLCLDAARGWDPRRPRVQRVRAEQHSAGLVSPRSRKSRPSWCTSLPREPLLSPARACSSTVAGPPSDKLPASPRSDPCGEPVGES